MDFLRSSFDENEVIASCDLLDENAHLLELRLELVENQDLILLIILVENFR